MAKYIPKNKSSDEINNELETVIMSDAFNLTPNFFNSHREKFENIRNSLGQILSAYGYQSSGQTTINPLDKYKSLLFNTMSDNDLKQEILKSSATGLQSGARSIAYENMNNGIETDIIQTFQRITNECFSLMNEYRVGASLIPEIKRVMKLVIRDILNADELTKRSIKNVYQIDDKLSYKLTENDIESINNYIDENITDKYKIEKKLPIWLYEMFITGAKPILVLPYRDVLKQAITLANNPQYNYSSESIDFNTYSTENLEEYVNTKIDITSKKFQKLMSTEVFEPKTTYKKYQATEEDEPNKPRDDYSDIITDNVVDELYNEGMEELYHALAVETEYAQQKMMQKSFNFGMEAASDSSDPIFDTVNKIKETIKKIDGEEPKEVKDAKDEKKKIKDKIRNNLTNFLKGIDNNVDFVKDNYNSLHLGKKELLNKKKHELYNKKHIYDGMYIKDKTELKNLIGDYDKEVILLELDPENVIPITNGSEHIAYYIFERDAYVGASSSSSRKSASFSQLMDSTGYGNDAALLSTQSGISIAPNDPAMSSIFSPMSAMTPMGSYGAGTLNENTDTNKRNEILKHIIYKTISNKMGDASLVDNKAFQDSIINLIRQGYIVNRRVQFTYVPAISMVYFAHDLDDKGLPHSILDNCLLKIYMYLACVISATMNNVAKASDKEKLEINMGLNGQIGMTMMEIQKNLSTRNVHVRSFFDNIGAVLRNTATYSRMTIPVIDGEKLYEVSSVDSNSNAEIDNEFIEKQLGSIMNAIPCPPSITNMIQDVEFSRGIINQNVEYRNSIMEKQDPIASAITKLYRLIALYTKIPIKTELTNTKKNLADSTTKPESDRNKAEYVNINDLNVKFSVPMYLNMVSIAETFSNIEPVMESYIKYHYGDGVEDNINKERLKRAKQELIKIFAPNIDFDEIEKVFDKIDSDYGDGLADTIKDKLTNDRIGSKLGDI
jgi:hypothetical protein